MNKCPKCNKDVLREDYGDAFELFDMTDNGRIYHATYCNYRKAGK